MLAGLFEAVDARPYMRGHGERVSALCESIAIRLGWSGERLRWLGIGARLHDIGKLAVSDDLWHKPGRFTEVELSLVQEHPTAGARMLSRLQELRFAIPYVLFHHERWDGGGYPTGRAGHAIPLEARVLAVADAFDAMTSARTYCAPLELDAALAEIEACAGTQFDPIVAGVFVELAHADAPPLRATTRPRASSAFGG
jgi:HD-GYP domain-containing protein (c-di-GMP phosphodiesterase class II)